MTTATRGCTGVFKAVTQGGTVAVVGGVQEWTLSEESEEIDASEIGTCTKATIAGATTRSLSLSGFWNAADAGQDDLVVGAIVDFELYPEGIASTSTFYETSAGGATVTSIEKSGGVDSLVTFSASLSINGALTESVVP